VLLVDLDYQASLTAMCIAPAVHSHLGNAQRTARQFFEAMPATPEVLPRCEELVDPDHAGYLVAADETLLEAEHRLLVGWLTGDVADDVRFRLRTLLHSRDPNHRHDVILLDCPPRFTPSAINALACSDLVIVPTPLDALNRERVILFAKWVARLKRERVVSPACALSVLANFVETSERQHVVSILQGLVADVELVGEQSLQPFDVYIPRRVAIRNAAARREFATLVDDEMGEVFTKLAEAVCVRLGLEPPGVHASD
jgi:cellulose biosynthesis protein BcsQ